VGLKTKLYAVYFCIGNSESTRTLSGRGWWSILVNNLRFGIKIVIISHWFSLVLTRSMPLLQGLCMGHTLEEGVARNEFDGPAH
jgi:hypothetical protein